MRRTLQSTLAILLMALPALCQQEQKKEYDPNKLSALGKEIAGMQFPPLVWQIPEIGKEITRQTLPNGLVVYIYPDHSVPSVHIQMAVRGGTLYETPAQDKLFSFLTDFISLGGSKARTFEEISAEREGIASSIYGWAGDETLAMNGRCLKARFPRTMELIKEILLEPGFRDEKLSLIRKQEAEGMLRQKDYPGWVIETLFSSQIYGEHPYGRIPRLARTEAITKAEIEAAYARFIVPNRAFIAISGDVEPKEALDLVKKTFGDWKTSKEQLPPVQKVDESVKGGYFHFEKDIPQSNIRLGHLGVRRGNPDEFAIDVMNMILGGEAFKSRLMTRIRSDEGLAYSAGSYFGTGGLEPSTFACYSETKNEKAFRTVTIMKETIAEMGRIPPTDDELKQAKETMINSFIHRWTDASGSLSQIMYLEIAGLPKDYYKTYLERLQAVGAQDVLKVGKKYLHPDNLVVVTVGKRGDMADWPKDLPPKELTLPPEYMK